MMTESLMPCGHGTRFLVIDPIGQGFALQYCSECQRIARLEADSEELRIANILIAKLTDEKTDMRIRAEKAESQLEIVNRLIAKLDEERSAAIVLAAKAENELRALRSKAGKGENNAKA